MYYLHIYLLLTIFIFLCTTIQGTDKSCPCECPKSSPKKCKFRSSKSNTQHPNSTFYTQISSQYTSPTLSQNSSQYTSPTLSQNSSQHSNSSESITHTNTNSSSNATQSSSNSSISVTMDEFKEALTANSYPIGGNITDQYNGFIAGIPESGISSKTELAMFYAEVIWESGGLKYTSEIACTPPCSSPNCCEGNYGPTYNGKVYYGRGYLQLSWQTNYESASSYLFNDPAVLRDNPDLVSNNQTVAWGSAFWYWKANVHNQPGISEGKFGVATKAINGPIECSPSGGAEQAHKRYAIYVKIFDAWKLPGTPNESGCYN